MFNVALLKEVIVEGDKRYKVCLKYDQEQVIVRFKRMMKERLFDKEEITADMAAETTVAVWQDLIKEFEEQTITIP